MGKNVVEFDRENLVITVRIEGQDDLIITKKNVQISNFSRGSGGQNLNRHENGVQLQYEIPEEYLECVEASRRLIARNIDSRSLSANTKKAFEQLADAIRKQLYKDPERIETSVPKRAKKKRIENKRRHGRKKAERRKSKNGES